MLKKENQNLALNDSIDLSSDSLQRFESIDGMDTISRDEPDAINAETDNLLNNPESKLWYKRVMRWTNENRRAYLMIKTLQTLVSVVLLTITALCYKSWKETKPDHETMHIIRVVMLLHSFDLLTYMADFLMVIKRFKFFISLRFILCCVSFTLGIMIQYSFFSSASLSGDTFVINF